MKNVSTADPIVKLITEETLIKDNIMSESMVKKIEKEGFIYICSIQAGSSAVSGFNNILKKRHQIESIKRYGQSSYWHFFVKCKEKERKKLILLALSK